ncbi:C40 family peptidase [Salinispora tropica]|uniref:NLP/P60 protein n=1 Tax=Salinispora tropica (strain ATCC BAA-916 / DSM 44818 / JCM 13857 / NBRC 105044 / CNB-440) TaxID=369723 RepID=A4XC59_SALTO|nr:C40 family peptidase [Salinispora tropica]ABP56516.1 NLP/P60 protein [Salinispora tropica CNB-440]
MGDSDHGRRPRRSPVISPVLRPKLWSALLGIIAAGALSAPVYADPPLPDTVPDSGARPVLSGPLSLPGGGPLTPSPSTPVDNLINGPLATQIYAAEARIGQLSDELLLLRQQRTEAETQLIAAEQELNLALTALAEAQSRADSAVADAIKAAAALPPAPFADDLQDLSELSGLARGEDVAGGETTAATRQLNRARADEQVAQQAMTAAQSRVRSVDTAYTSTEQALRSEEAKLASLREDKAAQLLELERQQEAAEQALGAQWVADETANGLVAHPIARAAVTYAMDQLGDPYLWAAEGPDRFDCSGLIWAAYRSADYRNLPRVSRDQYYATRHRTVPRTGLLPGDLLFFASGSSWTSIHHIGMYIGGGRMIHAPSSGDVVKISTVTWSRLYAATRVVGGVPAPPTPTPTPTASATPKPTSPPSASPSPSATSTPSPSTSPTSTPSPTTSPTNTPSPTTSPSPPPTSTPSPTTSPTNTPSPTTSPSAAPTSTPPPTTSSSTTPTGIPSPSTTGGSFLP